MTPATAAASERLRADTGAQFLSAAEALIKGVLESETPIPAITVPESEAFEPLLDLARREDVAQLLAQHGSTLMPSTHGPRAVSLAMFAARSSKAALCMVPNHHLDRCMRALREASTLELPTAASLCVLLEDDPTRQPSSCPRQAAFRLGLPTLEPGSLSQLRTIIDIAIRLSRTDRRALAIVVHRSILQSADTLEMKPNHLSGSIDVLTAARRSPRRRISESGGLLRVARRLELNEASCLPSPGERVPVGFIVIGPARASLEHLITVLNMVGRVPVLQLGMLNPVDDVAVGRLLARCSRVVVLEPRPGVMESRILDTAEAMRHAGEEPASIWGRSLPKREDGASFEMTSEADLHPSVLARKILHLLHELRPRGAVASKLTPDPPALSVIPAARGAAVGSRAAIAMVRRIIADVGRWLAEPDPEDELTPLEPRAMAVDGVTPPDAPDIVVPVEIWESQRFRDDGLAAITQAARANGPWVMIICALGEAEQQSIERLARAAAPRERADRVRIERASITETIELRDVLRTAVTANGLTVIVATESNIPRFDVSTLEADFRETDRLGFAPRQRRVWLIDQVCAIRSAIAMPTASRARSARIEAAQPEYEVDKVPRRRRRVIDIRIRPLIERIDVLRSRPPTWSPRMGDVASRLTPPSPIHASSTVWRAHLAGFRGVAPGPAAAVLCEAGRQMGYAVRCVYNAVPIAPGYRAGAQVLFTHPPEKDEPLRLIGSVPYGEADLLLGVDLEETLRAIGPDRMLRVAHDGRTHLVANIGAPEQAKIDQGRIERAEEALRAVTVDSTRTVGDFAAACRARLRTDRLIDIVVLGCAFQRGMIPLTVQSIEQALIRIESLGTGRCREAFNFGRHIAEDVTLLSRPREEIEDPVEIIARRTAHQIALCTRFSASRAAAYRGLVERSLDAMPSLVETDAGRRAHRDFVIALHRCLLWGGVEYAERFANLITSLYRVDRGERGRAITRTAILPLAEAMLIRDPIYIANVVLGPEHRQHARRLLNMRRGRGDAFERRYLIRIEILLWARRMRWVVRTSDWMMRIIAGADRFWPRTLRGTRRSRDRRRAVMEMVRHATTGAESDYEKWEQALTALHRAAAEDRLHRMSGREIDAVNPANS